MIIKGRARADGAALAAYLLKEHDHQIARLIDLRDSASADLTEALTDWEMTANALTKGTKPLYHVQIRLAAGENLTRDQWLHTIGKLEARLKLDGCPRAIVGHQLDGELHLHVAWSRLDLDREKLVHLSNDRKAHHAVARDAEKAFNLRQLNQVRDQERIQSRDKARGSTNQRDREYAQAKRGGTTRVNLEKLVTAAFAAADSPAAFDANLQRLGITLQRGRQRDYIIEHRGQVYNPVRFINGMTTATMRQKMNGYAPTPRERSDDQAGKANAPRRRVRAAKPPQPQLKPRLHYGDPGI